MNRLSLLQAAVSRSRALAAYEGAKIITAEHLFLAWLTEPTAGTDGARQRLSKRLSDHPRFQAATGELAVPGLLTRLRMRPEPALRTELAAALDRAPLSCPAVLVPCARAGRLDSLISEIGLEREDLLTELARASQEGVDG